LRLRVFARDTFFARKDTKTQSLKKAIGLHKKTKLRIPEPFGEQTGVLFREKKTKLRIPEPFGEQTGVLFREKKTKLR